MLRHSPSSIFFFFNDTATTEIYTLSLHDALPIYGARRVLVQIDVRNGLKKSELMPQVRHAVVFEHQPGAQLVLGLDRKSTRLNSSHSQISYAVFCLKKKKHRAYTLRPSNHDV